MMKWTSNWAKIINNSFQKTFHSIKVKIMLKFPQINDVETNLQERDTNDTILTRK